MDSPDLRSELALALELADLADAVTRPRYDAKAFTVDRKHDRTEVTEADRGAEAVMRRRLEDARPGHAVLGEEEGLLGDPDSPWRWVLDPVDGTSNFVKGVPIWSTLVALLHEGRPVIGVVSAPALYRRWWAGAGLGAFVSVDQGPPQPIHVSTIDTISEAHLAYASVASWREHADIDGFLDLEAKVWRSRGVGDFWQHMLVAEGAMDIAAECIVSLWDLAAVQIVVEEAGGRFTDLAGKAHPDGGSAVSTNGILHDETLRLLHRRS